MPLGVHDDYHPYVVNDDSISHSRMTINRIPKEMKRMQRNKTDSSNPTLPHSSDGVTRPTRLPVGFRSEDESLDLKAQSQQWDSCPSDRVRGYVLPGEPS